jgi:hypothetical protein
MNTGSHRYGRPCSAAVCIPVLALIEMFWWPKRRERLLTNADRAADIAAHLA